MPILSVAAMNRSLDNDYGTTAGPNAPPGHELALYNADPSLGGVEIAGGGYARVDVAPADWGVSVGGGKSVIVQFGAASSAWPEAKWWALIDGDDHVTVWDCAALNVPLTVAAGPGPEITVTVFYANTVTVPE